MVRMQQQARHYRRLCTGVLNSFGTEAESERHADNTIIVSARFLLSEPMECSCFGEGASDLIKFSLQQNALLLFDAIFFVRSSLAKLGMFTGGMNGK